MAAVALAAAQPQLQAAMRLAQALARFQTQLQADGRSPHTIAQYARHIRRFASWLEAEGLPDDVDAQPRGDPRRQLVDGELDV